MSLDLIEFAQSKLANDYEWLDKTISMKLLTTCKSDDKFSISIDILVESKIDSHKHHAKKRLEKKFRQDKDYIIIKNTDAMTYDSDDEKKVCPVHKYNYESIMLTVDCFKIMCMTANNEMGQKVREYYLTLEEIYQQWIMNVEQTRKAEADQKQLNETSTSISLVTNNHLQYSQLCINAATSLVPILERLGLDDRGKVIVKNFGYNVLMNLTNTSTPSSAVNSQIESSHPLSMTDMCKSMGIKFEKQDVQKLGKMCAQAYREQYRTEPRKQSQINEFGRSIEVCYYQEVDRALIANQIQIYARENPDRIRRGHQQNLLGI